MKLRSCYTLSKTNDFTQSYTYSDGKNFSVCCFFVKDFIESQSEELLNVNPALWSLLHILNGCMLTFFKKMFLGIFFNFGDFCVFYRCWCGYLTHVLYSCIFISYVV